MTVVAFEKGFSLKSLSLSLFSKTIVTTEVTETTSNMAVLRCSVIFLTWLLFSVVLNSPNGNSGLDKKVCSIVVAKFWPNSAVYTFRSPASIFKMHGRFEAR